MEREQDNTVCLRKLSQRQIRNAIKSNRIKASVTLKPKKRIAWWFILTRDNRGWNEPVMVGIR